MVACSQTVCSSLDETLLTSVNGSSYLHTHSHTSWLFECAKAQAIVPVESHLIANKPLPPEAAANTEVGVVSTKEEEEREREEEEEDMRAVEEMERELPLKGTVLYVSKTCSPLTSEYR